MTVIWGKIHHHLSFIMTCNDCNLGQNPDLVPEKSINILPAAPLLSCSLSVKEERSMQMLHKRFMVKSRGGGIPPLLQLLRRTTSL